MVGYGTTSRECVGATGDCTYDDFDQIFNVVLPLCIIDEESVIRRVNDSFCSFFEKTREEILFRRCSEVLSNGCRSKSNCVLEEALDGKALSPVEVEVLTANGNLRTCIVDGFPYVDRRGGRTGRMVGFTDITGRKQAETERARLEERLREVQKMESVGRLAGGVAHDFNNMLSVILGYTDILLESPSGGDEERSMIEEINKAGCRAQDLTRQLLAFSRRHALDRRVVDLNEIVRSNEKMLRQLTGERAVCQMYLSPVPARINADVLQILQVLMNLVVNARDAMRDGGKLLIETSRVTLDDESARKEGNLRPGAWALLLVSDTGQGMDQETKSFIFDPFFTTKEPGKGTGLGLSTVQGIVKQHGGYIVVESEPGHGTQFKVYLPRIEEDAAFRKLPSPLPGKVNGTETILLVDVEPMVRRLAGEILVPCGYKVIEAASPDEAIRLAEGYGGPLDLLLTDIVMPVMNGRELHRFLSMIRPGIRVLYMSGYAGDEEIDSCVTDDEGLFLDKPLTVDTLTRKVREVLDR
jgi:two-component system, cell cycle sensor histidine kinase and response regulator CckA